MTIVREILGSPPSSPPLRAGRAQTPDPADIVSMSTALPPLSLATGLRSGPDSTRLRVSFHARLLDVSAFLPPSLRSTLTDSSRRAPPYPHASPALPTPPPSLSCLPHASCLRRGALRALYPNKTGPPDRPSRIPRAWPLPRRLPRPPDTSTSPSIIVPCPLQSCLTRIRIGDDACGRLGGVSVPLQCPRPPPHCPP